MVYGSTSRVVGSSSPSLRYSISTTRRFSDRRPRARGRAPPRPRRPGSPRATPARTGRTSPRASGARGRAACRPRRRSSGRRSRSRAGSRAPRAASASAPCGRRRRTAPCRRGRCSRPRRPRVDRVAPAAEVDEVEERERLLQLLAGDREALGELVGVELAPSRSSPQAASRWASSAWRTPKRSGATGPAGWRSTGRTRLGAALAGRLGRGALVAVRAAAASAVGAPRRAAPAGRAARRGRSGGEPTPTSGSSVAYSVSKTPSTTAPGVGERAVHPPRGVALDGDPRHADRVADLPRPRRPVRLDVELGRQAEVALAPRREADVASGSARRGRSGRRVAVEIVPDDVPDALVEPKRVRVQRRSVSRSRAGDQ